MIGLAIAARRILPKPLHPLATRIRFYAELFIGLRGLAPRTCPCCGYTGKFSAIASPPRYDGECRKCHSRERHRLLKLWLDRNKTGDQLGKVLHFAPEDAVTRSVKPFAETYITADILKGRADVVLDIENLDLEENSIDTIVCMHVLEHVNDEKALKELHRVLRPGGIAFLMFPIVEGWATTYESDAVVTPKDKLLHYGQEDHVRWFGRDVRERIRDAGFDLENYVAEPDDVVKYSLVPGECLFIARK